MSSDYNPSRPKRRSQAQITKPLPRNKIHPLLRCDIIEDIRPFEWPKRKPRPNPNWREPQQLDLFNEETIMNNNKLLKQALMRPIAFHRIFARIAGSITAGLFLSQAYYWAQREQDEKDGFYKTQEEWTEETELSRYEQESARKRLKTLGLLAEVRKGVPLKMYYKLNQDRLTDLILEHSLSALDSQLARPSMPNAAKPHSEMIVEERPEAECGETTLANAEKPHSFTIHRFNTESINPSATGDDGPAMTDESVLIRESEDVEVDKELEAQLDEFFKAQDDYNPVPEVPTQSEATKNRSWGLDSAVGGDALNGTLPVTPYVGEENDEGQSFASELPPEHSQAYLFTPSSLKLKKPSKGGLVLTNPMPVAAPYHQIMYRICFMAVGPDEVSLLSQSQRARVNTILVRMREAKVDMTRFDDFQIWWAGTWMSKEKVTGNYQPPTPEKVAEHWFVAMKQLDSLRPADVQQQVQVSKAVLEQAMMNRASQRNGEAGGDGYDAE